MTLVTVLLVSLGFVVLNALFVAAEFALIAAPAPAIERRSSAGDRLSRQILGILQSPIRQDRYIATAQLGITLASLGLGMYGEHALAGVIANGFAWYAVHPPAATATVLSLTFLTILHIVVGEMVPKGVALQEPERTARIAHLPMRVMLVVLYPFVALSNGIARLCLSAIGIRRRTNTSDQVYTPEELQLIVEESERGGAIAGESGKILRELFDFGDLTASQVMVPRVRVVGIPVGATPDAIRQLVLQHRRARYVVYEDDLDHVVGMLHAKDLLRHLMTGQPVTAGNLRRIPVVPATASVDAVLSTLQRAGAHMAVAIDEHGGTAGLVGLEDLFEEVVGEIDEGAPVAPALEPGPDGSVLVAGTLRLDELGQHFDLSLEHEEVDSVSGLVLAILGRPPSVGDTVEWERMRFVVTETSGRGVRRAQVSIRPLG